MTTQARSGRSALVLAAIAGLIWMHSLVALPLVADPPMLAATHVTASSASHDVGDDDPVGSGHHGGNTLTQLCLGVLASTVGLLTGLLLGGRRRTGLLLDAPVQAGPPTGSRVWHPPPRDVVRELSISRT